MTMQFIKNWWKTWTEVEGNWQKILPAFRPIILRLFVTWFALAPIFVRIFNNLPEQIEFFLNSVKYTINLSLPFSWQILWISSCFYFISYILFFFTCPRFIKTFPSFSKFLSEQHSPRFLIWELFRVWRDYKSLKKLSKRLIKKSFALEVNEVPSGDNPRVDGDGTVFWFLEGNNYYEVAMNENAEITRQRELFWEIYALHAKHAIWRRNIAWIFLTVSLLLVVCVVLEQILSVMIYLLG